MAPSVFPGRRSCPGKGLAGPAPCEARGPRAGPLRLFQRALHSLAAVVVAFVQTSTWLLWPL